MRHWKELNIPNLYGVDYNADLLKWSRKYLTFAKYEVNNLTSRLKFNDAMFDFVYVISVFTHLSKELQFFWMDELKRILKPGGILLITVHGITRMHQLSKIQQQQFLAGNLIIAGQLFSGTNLCSTYHPEQYVKKVFAKDFELLDFLSGGARDANQDMYLFRKSIM